MSSTVATASWARRSWSTMLWSKTAIPSSAAMVTSWVRTVAKSQFLNVCEAARTWMLGSRPTEDLSGNQPPDFAHPLTGQPVIDSFLDPTTENLLHSSNTKSTRTTTQFQEMLGPAVDRSPAKMRTISQIYQTNIQIYLHFEKSTNTNTNNIGESFHSNIIIFVLITDWRNFS